MHSTSYVSANFSFERFRAAYASGMPLTERGEGADADVVSRARASRRTDAPFVGGVQRDRALSRHASFATAAEEDRPIPVSEVLARLDEAVRSVFPKCWIAGEVSQVTRSRLGHFYFSLKDEKGALSCVIWRSKSSIGIPEEGESVEMRGEIQIYGPRGSLQLSVDDWRPAGRGALWEAFLRLKAKLEAEGLFDAAIKKPLPIFPKRIAVVTSETAAAFGDVRRTLARRMPWVQLVLAEAAVQGATAPESLIRALRLADEAKCDVILLVRGGGAYEDLQAFNDEALARTLRSLKTPVVSGIGHETDFTIADFAADVRASTPTAAAEMVGRDSAYWLGRVLKAEETMSRTIVRELRSAEERLDRADLALPSGARLMALFADKVSAAARQLDAEAFRALARRAERVRISGRAFEVPEAFFERYDARMTAGAQRLESALGVKLGESARLLQVVTGRLDDAALRRLSAEAGRYERARRLAPNPLPLIERAQRTVAALGRTLEALDPDRPLRSGYARISTAAGVVSSVQEICSGDALVIEFGDGQIGARATGEIKKGGKENS